MATHRDPVDQSIWQAAAASDAPAYQVGCVLLNGPSVMAYRLPALRVLVSSHIGCPVRVLSTF